MYRKILFDLLFGIHIMKKFIALVFIAILISCSNKVQQQFTPCIDKELNKNPGSSLLPLQTGNSWQYSITYFDEFGGQNQTRYLVLRVGEETSLSLMHKGSVEKIKAYKQIMDGNVQPDKYFTKCGNESYYLYSGEDSSEFISEAYTIINNPLVGKQDPLHSNREWKGIKVKAVPAGTWDCWMLEINDVNDSIITRHEYYVKDVGLIRQDDFGFEDRLRKRMELVTYKLKD